MSQASLDSVQRQTGKTATDFRAESDGQGAARRGDIVRWLEGSHGLGHGHANAVATALLNAGHVSAPQVFTPQVSTPHVSTLQEERVQAVFSGKKATDEAAQ